MSLIDKSGPEIGLISYIYESLPSIYHSEISGLEAFVQDHYLDDRYD